VAAEAYASPLAAVYPVCCGTQPDVDVAVGALPPFSFVGRADSAADGAANAANAANAVNAVDVANAVNAANAVRGWFVAFPSAAAAAADLDVALAAAARHPCVVAFRAGTAGVAAEKLRGHPLSSRGFRGADGATEYFVVGRAPEDAVAEVARLLGRAP
jgi:hypothetical protein